MALSAFISYVAYYLMKGQRAFISYADYYNYEIGNVIDKGPLAKTSYSA